MAGFRRCLVVLVLSLWWVFFLLLSFFVFFAVCSLWLLHLFACLVLFSFFVLVWLVGWYFGIVLTFLMFFMFKCLHICLFCLLFFFREYFVVCECCTIRFANFTHPLGMPLSLIEENISLLYHVT